jgi:hydrogenase maturation protease
MAVRGRAERGDPGLLVLGIGNDLRSDDGVGVHVVRAIGEQSSRDDGTRWLDGGTLGLALLEPIERCDALIVVDAVELGAAPGTLCVLEGPEMDLFVDTAAPASAHEAGLGALRAAALLRGRWPERRALVGVQPAGTDWGTSLSPAVQRAVPEAVRAIQCAIARWTP